MKCLMLAGVWDAKNTNDSIDMCDMCCLFLAEFNQTLGFITNNHRRNSGQD